jgi:hypothetical protein
VNANNTGKNGLRGLSDGFTLVFAAPGMGLYGQRLCRTRTLLSDMETPRHDSES